MKHYVKRIANKSRHRVGAYKRTRGMKVPERNRAALFSVSTEKHEKEDPWLAELRHQANKEAWHEKQALWEETRRTQQEPFQGISEESQALPLQDEQSGS